MRLYEAYRKRKYDTGGGIETQQDKEKDFSGFGSAVGIGAAVGSSVIDMTGEADPLTGRRSVGSSVGKGALSGAAMGAQLGPLGAGIGAVLGAGMGFLTGNKEKKEARSALAENNAMKRISDMNRSQAMLATNPEMVEGYRNSGYFATGGNMIDPPVKKSFNPNLAAKDTGFQKWYGNNTLEGKNKIPYSDSLSYDYFSFYRNGDYKNPQYNINDHFPDTYKRDTHPTFSNESIYSVPGNTGGRWEGEKFIKKANGGDVKAPLASMYMNGGYAKTLSSDNTELVGDSHSQGGIDIPKLGAEVEGKETTKGSYVFSDKLGFAADHKKIALAKGKIEKKPPTPERVNSMKLLNAREEEMILAQEFLKHQKGLA